MNQLSVSILNSDFGDIRNTIEMINQSEADMIHCDIMDGVFVPNLTFGMPLLKSIQKIARKPLDVHLMIQAPERYIASFREAGASLLTVHYEASIHLHRTLQKIKQEGMQCGVALNPHTPVSVLEEILTDLDLVLIMTVNPGFGGQQFIENSYNKIQRLKENILRKNAKTLIEVDGGVGFQNFPLLKKAGVDIMVVGNTIFSTKDPAGTIASLKNLCE